MIKTRFRELIERLSTHDVEFIVVGGVAARAHGIARVTQDLDVVYSHTPENCDRLVRALSELVPYPRGARADFLSSLMRNVADGIKFHA